VTLIRWRRRRRRRKRRRRRRRRRRKVYSKEAPPAAAGEGIFIPQAVNEEDSERDRAFWCGRQVPPCYVPGGDSPLSLQEEEEGQEEVKRCQ